jgi:hypothetical protein
MKSILRIDGFASVIAESKKLYAKFACAIMERKVAVALLEKPISLKIINTG